MASFDLPISELRERLESYVASESEPKAAYRDLLGFVPPCTQWHTDGTLEQALQGMHEQMRRRTLVAPSLDAKTAHLILLGMLLREHGAGARSQALAARRAGASWDELQAVIALAFLLHGLPAVHRGDELLRAVAEREHDERVAGAVAAYG